MRDIVQMPEMMTPAIQEAIRQQRWKIAPNPLASIRTAAHQEAKRMGLTEREFAGISVSLLDDANAGMNPGTAGASA